MLIAACAARQQQANPIPTNPVIPLDSILADSALPNATAPDTSADSTSADTSSSVGDADSVSTAENQEDSFQQSLDSLFDPKFYGIDTFAWTNDRINSGYQDHTALPDTVRVLMIDSAKNELYVHPFKNVVTSDFGERRWLWHYGVDIRLAKGDTVKSAFNGIVRVIQYDRHGYGNVVVIRHPRGLETVYGHLSKKLMAPNQKVKAGDVVGFGGRTGRSSGSHLHFEIRYYGEPFDPNHLIDFANYRLKNDTLVLTKENFEYLIEQRKAKWYTIRKGDTLGHIARKCGSSVNKLCNLNHISGKTLLRIGRKIRYQ